MQKEDLLTDTTFDLCQFYDADTGVLRLKERVPISYPCCFSLDYTFKTKNVVNTYPWKARYK
jgi:hypothetical protein